MGLGNRGKFNIAVNKIAILNPYLQGGHFQIAETESAKRYIDAAKNLGITAEMFSNSADVDSFKPDLVVAITYQEGKLTKYPTYVSLNTPPSLIKNEVRFIRNLLSFDGFLTLSDSVIYWLEKLCREHQKPFYFTKAAFSVPKLPFFECDFSKATAMYMGTNWDGNRHSNFFNALDGSGYLTCYGPKKSWCSYTQGLYGGEVPFDGVSVINQYRSHGVGLCIGHPAFDSEGIANNRLFEVPAASTLAICAKNSLTQAIYGDTVLFMDNQLNQEEYIEQFMGYVEWVRVNTRTAAEMSRAAHQIYNDNLCMEQQIINLVKLHQVVISEKYHCSADTLYYSDDPIYLVMPALDTFEAYLPILEALENQTIPKLTLCFYELVSDIKTLLTQFFLASRKLVPLFYDTLGVLENQLLLIYQKQKHGWVSYLENNITLFDNHFSILMRALNQTAQSGNVCDILLARYVEHSYVFYLPDYIQDVHKIYDENNLRLENHEKTRMVPRGIVLFNLALLEKIKIPSQAYFSEGLLKSLKVVTAEEVTSQVNIDSIASQGQYQSIDRLFEQLNSSSNDVLVAHIKQMKKIIFEQEKEIKQFKLKSPNIFTTIFHRIKCFKLPNTTVRSDSV